MGRHACAGACWPGAKRALAPLAERREAQRWRLGVLAASALFFSSLLFFLFLSTVRASCGT